TFFDGTEVDAIQVCWHLGVRMPNHECPRPTQSPHEQPKFHQHIISWHLPLLAAHVACIVGGEDQNRIIELESLNRFVQGLQCRVPRREDAIIPYGNLGNRREMRVYGPSVVKSLLGRADVDSRSWHGLTLQPIHPS